MPVCKSRRSTEHKKKANHKNKNAMSDYTKDSMALCREGLWDESGWAERYVTWMSEQDPQEVASELRMLLTHLSHKELCVVRDTFENHYLDEDVDYQ